MIKYTVSGEDAGIRLDRWFKRHLPQISQGLLQKALRKGGVKVSDRRVEAGMRISGGDVIAVSPGVISDSGKAAMESPSKKRDIPEGAVRDFRASVIYADNDIVAINKPSGLAVQGGSKVSYSVDDLLHYLENGEQLKLAHRLDKDTSGLLLLARGAKAAAELTGLFKDRAVEKTYLALVYGMPLLRDGKVEMDIGKSEVNGGASFERVQAGEGGRHSLTHYKVLESLGKRLSLLELKPHTGRMHQLRVHCAELNCPIVGDDKYGTRSEVLKELGIENKLHLHALSITFPWRGKQINLGAPLSGHMQKTCKLLGIGG